MKFYKNSILYPGYFSYSDTRNFTNNVLNVREILFVYSNCIITLNPLGKNFQDLIFPYISSISVLAMVGCWLEKCN